MSLESFVGSRSGFVSFFKCLPDKFAGGDVFGSSNLLEDLPSFGFE